METTSTSLLRRLRETQDEKAWTRFVDLYGPLIFYWGRQHGLNSTDAADLVQDVMTVLVAKLPAFEYDPRKRFRGWLRTITLNRLRDAARRKAAVPGFESPEMLKSQAASGKEGLFEETEYRSYIATRALHLMRSEFREEIWQACWKQVVEGKTASEVASELHLTINTAYLAKSRVLSRLREELDGLWE